MSDTIERHLSDEVHSSLARGALYAAAFGMLAGVFILVAVVVTGDRFGLAPGIYAIGCGAYALLIYAAARARRMVGATRYFVMIPFAALPTAFFLITGPFFPAGTATFIHGAYAFLYAFLIIITGFFFSARLSMVCALVAASGYMLAFTLAQPTLAALPIEDAILHTDLSGYLVAFNKAMMILAVGGVVAGLSVFTKRLIRRVLNEERLFGQYVSDAVRERIVSRGELSQRKEMALLFSDIRGFSSFSEGREPEEVVGRLNAYFEEMVGAIEAEGGVVDKFIGDAVMATFGGVTELDDPCAAAVRGARGMRRGLAALNARWNDGTRFDNGIGVHFGSVVQGPLGASQRKEFTVIGDAVNTAARVEGLTKGRQPILITRAVFDALPQPAQAPFVALGATAVKGKSEEVEIYGLDD